MKKIIVFICIVLCISKSFAQYPNGKQVIGNDSNVVEIKGALLARVLNKVFADTTAANLSHMKEYPGAQIFTTSNNIFWLRNSTATQWISAFGGVSNITIINDSTFSICNFNSCDTFYTTTNPIQSVTVLDDSTLLVCYIPPDPCDTFHVPRTQFIQNIFDTTSIYNAIQNVYNYFGDTSFTNQFFPRGDGVLADTAIKIGDTLRIIYTDGTQNDYYFPLTLNDTTISILNQYFNSVIVHDTTFILSANFNNRPIIYSTTDSTSGNDSLHHEYYHPDPVGDSVLSLSSTANPDGTRDLVMKVVASTTIDTTSLSNRIDLKLNISDTTNKWVQDARSNAGGDSLIVTKNGVRSAYKYPSGGSLTLTTNNHAGAATYSAPTLNIPIYQANLGWVNVMDYGADSTGATDNSTAFTNAMNALGTRGTLYIPKGNFKFTATWTINKSINILGEGGGKDYGYYSATKISCATNIDVWKITKAGVQIEKVGLEWTGGSEATSAKGIYVLQNDTVPIINGVTYTQKFTFRDITIHDFYDNIYIEKSANWIIDGCTLSSAERYNVYVSNTENQDAGDWFINNTLFFQPAPETGGYGIFHFGSGGGKITNCKFNASLDYDIWSEMKTRSSVLLISNSSFENFKVEAIHIDSSYFVNINGCQFGDYQSLTGRAIVYYNVCNGGSITGNTFRTTNSNDTGIVVNAGSQVAICGNAFYGSFTALTRTSLIAGTNNALCASYALLNGLSYDGTTGTFSNTLITGLGTDQTVYGGTTSAGKLRLSSTTHATPGYVTLGPFSTGFVYDEANVKVGMGGVPAEVIDITKSIAGAATIKIKNSNTGTAGYASIDLANSASTASIRKGSTGETAYGNLKASDMQFYNATGDFSFRNDNASGAFSVQLGAASTDLFKIGATGKINFVATNTAAGTTGAQTINKASGTVNFAAGATTLVVTNSFVTTASLVFAEVRTNDATAYIKNVIPAAGSFTITLGAAATAETSVGFFVIN